ncbi:SusC/RagA family TonB-linked outer membrane protein [Algibacter amylolyticus]|nr:TonB-dependent receptor [Algibacter amylolyticus]MBB5268757.1 TonB-linked SusC/RagA family outer membrane protein [Algibacter amylolyticus]
MKVFVFLICTSTFSLTNTKAFAQEKIIIDKDKLVTPNYVFKIIKRQTNFSFVYPKNLFENGGKIQLIKGEVFVIDLISKVLSGSNFSFEVTNNNTIYIKKKLKVSDDVQQIEVKGVVTDEIGQPLPGANIIEKGTVNGTQSDFDGNFIITTTSENTVLIVSYVGYKTKEVQIQGNKTRLSIKLKEDAASLDEVVIVGYGTIKKSDLTGSVTSVKSERITETPAVRLDDALRGAASGLQITPTSSQPGAAASIRIRGTNSINGNSSPLFVIDGYIGSGNNVFINNNDIESIEVLKDASATALYGSRGSAGVILITTKRGKAGKPKINYDSFVSMTSPQRLLSMLNAREYAEFQNEVKGSEVFDVDSFGKGTNWQDEVYKNSAITTSHTLSVSGQEKSTNYYMSGNYLNQEGIYVGSELERFQTRVNLDTKIGDKLKIGLNINYAKTESAPYSSRITDVAGYLPTLPVRDENGEFTIQTFTGEVTNDNPIGIVSQSQRVNDLSNLLMNVYGEYEILDGLKYKLSIGSDNTWTTLKSYDPSTLFSEVITKGTGSITNRLNRGFLIENTLTYDKEFGDHSFNALAGYTRQTIKDESSSVSTSGFVSDVIGFNDLSAGEVFENSTSSASEFGIVSYLARINYNYKGRYLLTLSSRVDGSSNFSEGNKHGFFPAIGAGWNVGSESFMDESVFTNLKLRASYGILGNPAAGNSSLSRLEVGFPYTFGTGGAISNSIQLTTIGNPNLKFETTEQLDLGFDFGFFSNKLQGSLDYYHKTTNDLFTQREILLLSGVNNLSVISNFGTMKNQGVELSLDATILNKGDWMIDASFNISTNQNELVSIPEEDGELIINTIGIASGERSAILREGEPVGSFYGFKADGIWNNQAEIDASGITAGQTLFPGGKRYQDISGPDGTPDGIIDDNDRTIIGDVNPDFFGGFTTGISYKGIELRTVWNFSVGNDIFNETSTILDNAFDNNVSAIYADRWTPLNTDSNIVGVEGLNRSFKFADTDIVEDGSFLRLRTISLSYNIPTDKLKWMSAARISITGVNQLLFDNYSGYDPEVSRRLDDGSESNTRQGYDASQDPSTKAWTVGINLTF